MRNDRPLHIAHVIEGFAGGTATYLGIVLPELVSHGFGVSLICSTNRAWPDAREHLNRLKDGGVDIYFLNMCREINPLRDIPSFIRLFNRLRKLHPDVVHTHCSKAGALGRVAATLLNIPTRLHSPHCFAFLRSRRRFTRKMIITTERLLGKLTTKLVTVGHGQATLAVRLGIVPRARCTTILNGLCDRNTTNSLHGQQQRLLLRKSMNIGEDQYVVASLCRLVDYKGVFHFLEASNNSKIDNAFFLLAGEGELMDAAKEFIAVHNLSHKTKLLGFIKQVEQIYAIADLIVLCSDAEGCPYVILEAMRAKCPIVATSVIGIKEHIKHDVTGILISPSATDLASQIDSVLSDENKRQHLSTNAYDHFRQNYLLERQISQICHLYQTTP